MSGSAHLERETNNRSNTISVLNLTTSPDATFFRTQVESLERHNVECDTLAVPGEADGRDPDMNRSPSDYLRFFPIVRDALSSHDYDIVHANYGLTAPHALAQFQAPVVLSLWGSDVNGSFGWLSKLTAPRCDAVIVMSEPLGEQLRCDYTVLPHGIDLDQFRPIPQARARDALGWQADASHVLFPSPVAREEKDFPRAERVVEATRDRVSRPVVLQTPNGNVPHEQMPLLMNAADCLLLTSKHEGFPNAVKEAMACNLPVVSTDVGSVGSRLEPVSPSTVASTDAELTRALLDVLERGERSNGRAAVADLDHDRVAERLEAVYRSVLDDGP